jgi:hypothetical protein
VLRDDEYLRLQATFLAIATHSDQPSERARWLALVHACQEELLLSTGSALHSDLARLAIAACRRSAKDTSRQPCTAIDQGGDRAGLNKEKPSASRSPDPAPTALSLKPLDPTGPR